MDSSAPDTLRGMAKIPTRPRMIFDCSERLRRALNINAARTNRTVGEVIESIAEQFLEEDLAIADRSISQGETGPTPKRGRKPKGE